MSRLISTELIDQKARIVEAPVKQVVVDRTFELPRGLYIATVACYIGFLGIMAAAFSTPGLIIPMAIFAFFIVAGFAIPTIWTRLKPDHKSAAKSASRFASEGIMTNTGRLAPRDAAIQVLILPVLIVLWGLAVVMIAATV
ncbi:hypothetical protein [Altererythrobacter lutimaris]|uniref:Uncharacterized protein n=1 Tax=Altererythrobacter lutimaris TaxID=2743979 RepID=A0A850HBY1_9SPHN|nr:hypothetical protein [Altererythrobacter lutimaris]NVE94511.1 hypothetical protein [Altererythrobacter lutimaris]